MSLRVSRVLHAGWVFEHDGVEIAFDPVFESPFSVNCHAFPPVTFDRDQLRRLRFDAVFISHFHEDHLSLESLDLLDRRTPIHLYAVHAIFFDLVRALGFTDVHAIELDRPIVVGPFEVRPRPALDVDVDSIFHVRAAGLEVLHVVDAWIDPDTFADLERSAPWDLVIWPFQTMRELEVLSPSRATPAPPRLPDEWREQLTRLRPRYVVPGSCQFQMEPWSWYNQAFFPVSYRSFREEVEALVPGARVVRMDPSRSIVLDAQGIAPAPPLPWVVPVVGAGPGAEAEEVDYRYDPALVPPSTAEVARQLPPLGPEETAEVLAWCRGGLLERHRALGPPAEPYFDEPRRWRLSLHHHDGAVTELHYRVHGEALTLAAPDDGPLAWTTELPAVKLHGALTAGESLTSIYARVLDVHLAPALEAELADVDLLQDPLLRALYAGDVASYQRAQLARLEARGRADVA